MHPFRRTLSVLLLALSMSACSDDSPHAADGGSGGGAGASGVGGAGVGGSDGNASGVGGTGAAGGAGGITVADAGVSGTIPAPRYPSKILAQRDAGCVIRADNQLACWDHWGDPTTSLSDGIENAVSELYLSVPDLSDDPAVCVLRPGGGYACQRNFDRSGYPPPSGTYLQLALGDGIVCGLTAEGNVVCWDDRSFLVDGVPSGAFVQLESTGVSICGLRPDGTVSCWYVTSETPQLPDTERYVQIAMSRRLACGITVDSRLVCVPADATPTPWDGPIPTGKVRMVSAGNVHGCAILEDDTVRCFGRLGPNYSAPAPTQRFSEISSGWLDDCAIAFDDSVWCWGDSGGAFDDPRALDNADGTPLIAKHL